MRRICFSFHIFTLFTPQVSDQKYAKSHIPNAGCRGQGRGARGGEAKRFPCRHCSGLAWAAAGHWGAHLMLGVIGSREQAQVETHALSWSTNTLALNSLFILSYEIGLSWGQRACPGPRAVTKDPQPHWSAPGRWGCSCQGSTLSQARQSRPPAADTSGVKEGGTFKLT